MSRTLFIGYIATAMRLKSPANRLAYLDIAMTFLYLPDNCTTQQAEEAIEALLEPKLEALETV